MKDQKLSHKNPKKDPEKKKRKISLDNTKIHVEELGGIISRFDSIELLKTLIKLLLTFCPRQISTTFSRFAYFFNSNIIMAMRLNDRRMVKKEEEKKERNKTSNLMVGHIFTFNQYEKHGPNTKCPYGLIPNEQKKKNRNKEQSTLAVNKQQPNIKNHQHQSIRAPFNMNNERLMSTNVI